MFSNATTPQNPRFRTLRGAVRPSSPSVHHAVVRRGPDRNGKHAFRHSNHGRHTDASINPYATSKQDISSKSPDTGHLSADVTGEETNHETLKSKDSKIASDQPPWKKKLAYPPPSPSLPHRELALYMAILAGQTEIVKELLDKGAHLNERLDKRADNGHSFGSAARPIHLAVATGRVKMVKFLIERGAFLNLPDAFGRTPLMVAVDAAPSAARKRIVQMLLEKGVNHALTDKQGRDALQIAQERRNGNDIVVNALKDGIKKEKENRNLNKGNYAWKAFEKEDYIPSKFKDDKSMFL